MYYKSMTVNELVAKARGRRQRDGGKTADQQANIGPAVHPTPIQQPSNSHPAVHPPTPAKTFIGVSRKNPYLCMI